MESLRAEYRELVEKEVRCKKVETMLKHGIQEETKTKEAMQQSLKQLTKEQKDVTKLENASFSKIMFTVLGKLDQQLEKEETEAAHAKAIYYVHKQAYEEAVYQVQKLNEEFLSLQYVANKILEVKHNLKQEMISQDSELFELDTKRAKCSGQLKEIEEAIHAGQNAQRQATKVLDILSSANNWALYDMLGGGVVSDMMKYQKLDEAQEELEYLQQKISSFQRELADVDLELIVSKTSFSFSTRMFDIAFDNIFSDYSVRSNINSAKTDMNTVISKIEKALELLVLNKQEEQTILQQLDTAITNKILK